jgi:tetratricopeptide (TPR) repeat protein
MTLARAGRLVVALCAASLATTVVTAAEKAEAAPPPDKRDEAKRLSAEGATAFKLAHFDEALALYSKAYELYPAPALLFNLGQCHKNLGHLDRALFFFQGYLRDQPNPQNRAAVDKLVAELTKQIADAKAAEAAAEAERLRVAELDAQARAAEAERQAEEEAARARAAAAPAPPPPPPPPRHRRPALIAAGAAVGGTGVVLLAVGTYFGLHAVSNANALSKVSSSGESWTTGDASLYSNGVSSAHAATGLFVAGGVAVAAGAALTIVGLQKHATESGVRLGWAPERGGSSFAVVGDF